MSFWRVTLAVCSLTAAIACGKNSSPTSPSPTNVSVSIASNGFTPNPINISVGSSVTWTNNDTSMHGVVANDGAFRSDGLATGRQYSYLFPTAGTFRYHDLSNASVVGTVNVSGSSSASPYCLSHTPRPISPARTRCRHTGR